MTDEKDDSKLSISTVQVVASALAAMSVAFLTSWAGTTGTIIGAFLGSIIATVGTAAYSYSLRRTSAVVKQTAAQVRHTALMTQTLPRTVGRGPRRRTPTSSGPAPDPANEPANEPADDPVHDPVDDPAAEQPEDGETAAAPGRWDAFPWKKTLLATAAVLLLCVLGITTLEAVTGRSMASLSGHDDSRGTTVGNVFDNDSDEDRAPAPTQDPTPTSGPGDDATQAPTQEAEPSSTPTPTAEPSQSASPDTSQPSASESETP